MKITVFILLFLSPLMYLNAQDIEFGEVSKEELLEEEYPLDKSANAVVLYKKQETYFISNNGSSDLITEIHERIKIYNKDGFDYATQRLSMYKSGSTSENISKLKAYTYNLENDKIVKTELDKDQIFENEVNYNYKEIKFTLPNIKEGSVIEYRYKLRSPFI